MTVGALDIRTVTYPSGLKTKYENGKIPLADLTKIGDRGYLYGNAARAWTALAFMCMSVGLPLTYTYGGTNRSYADQLNLWYQRMTTEKVMWGTNPNTGQAIYKTKVWDGVTWYLRHGLAGCAVPGTSNHGWALAIDTAFDPFPFDADGISPADAEAITSHPQWPKFKEFVLACGFSWEDTSEPWHIRYCLGDAVSQLVLDCEKMYGTPVVPVSVTPEPAPEPVPTPVPPATPDEEEIDVFKQVVHPGTHKEWTSLIVVGGAASHLTLLGNGTPQATLALKLCGQVSSESVERGYFVDHVEKCLRGLGYDQAKIAEIVAAVPA